MAFSPKKQSDAPRRRQQTSSNAQAQQPSLDEQSALFRRNRTLTGSVSSRIGSASEQQGNLKSARVQAHELADQRRRIAGVLFVIVAVAGLLAVLVWQFTAHVVIATPGVNAVVDGSKYSKAIEEYYGQNPFERLRFAVNQQRLTDFIRTSAPEVKSVIISGGAGFATSRASVVMREPIAGWKMDTTQYYVDGQGVSFITNYFDSPTVQIVDQSGVRLEAGTAIASNRFLGYVGRTVATAARNGLVVEQVIIPVGTTREINLRIKGVSSSVKLLIDRPVGQQIEDLVRALAYFKAKGQQPEYIDVRVSNKAYYK
jgi:hypothetical protein